MIRLGLFLYDHLGGRKRLPPSHAVTLARDPAGRPLKPTFTRAFDYADCWVDDARLVVLNAVDADTRGARVLTRSRCLSARRDGALWTCEIAGRGGTVRARALVNAAGPWAGRVLEHVVGAPRRAPLRLIKGSHIVVPRLYEGEHAYILQNRDRRVVFVIPYEGAFSLIGTTDVPFEGDPARVDISADEVDYLCAAVNHYFAEPVRAADVVWSYAGVRPLYDDAAADPSSVTRDYVLDLDDDGPPLLSVFGGKITTYRRLAEHAMARLAPTFPGLKGAWTAHAPLPGGDIADADFDAFLAGVKAARPWLAPALAHRLARAYGTRIDDVLGDARARADLGRHFGAGLHEREVRYLMANEWAQTADDILWRRTKIGLHLDEAARAAFAAWLAGADARAAAAP